jgi:hypothetical protein
MKFYAKTNSELTKNKIRLRKVKPVIGNNFDAIKFLLNMINLNKKNLPFANSKAHVC